MKKELVHICSLVVYCTLSMVLIPFQSIAQNAHDECTQAFQLPATLSYCSDPVEFSNTDATPGAPSPASCYTGSAKDVWFRFTAQSPNIAITVEGLTLANPAATLKNPEVALYSGDCTALTELGCAAAKFTNNMIELYGNGLVVGNTYFIRVQGAAANEGTFRLCFYQFARTVVPQHDCATATILCDTQTFVVPHSVGEGSETDELGGAGCIPPNGETNSTWLKWTCEKAGSFTFRLTPLYDYDDLDFILYEIPNGIEDCEPKNVLRCMGAGAFEDKCSMTPACCGATGLAEGETDFLEMSGCLPENNNFLAPVDLEEGKKYALFINHTTLPGFGFKVEFGGTATFKGIEANFEVLPDDVVCQGTPISVSDLSEPASSVTDWSWSFGANANPPSANGSKDAEFTMNEVGKHSIVMTVTSDFGCTAGKTIDYTIVESPKPDILLQGNGIYCAGQTIKIADEGVYSQGVQRVWTLTGAVPATSTDSSFSFSNVNTGVHNIKFLVMASEACKDSVTITYEIKPSPKAGFEFDPANKYCEGTGITVHDQTDPLGTNIVSQKWVFNGATPASSDNNPSPVFVPGGAGNYVVKLIVSNDANCTDSITKNYQIFSNPTPNFSAPAPVCIGKNFTLTDQSTSNGGNITSYEWDFGPSSIPPSATGVQNPELFRQDSNVFIVKLKIANQGGCTDSLTRNLRAQCCPDPVMIFPSNHIEIETGDSVLLQAGVPGSGEGFIYDWMPSDGLGCPDCAELFAKPILTTIYTLKATDKWGCSSFDTVRISVLEHKFEDSTSFFVPNVFTPNEDFVNDLFTIYANDGVTKVNYLKIYDRWGALLWENKDFPVNDEQKGWDGIYKGKYVNTGVYVYIAELELWDKRKVLLRGTVSVLK